MTLSDEFRCRDMSFLQTAKTGELVDIAGGLTTRDLLAVTPGSQQQQQQPHCRSTSSMKSKVRTLLSLLWCIADSFFVCWLCVVYLAGCTACGSSRLPSTVA